MHDQPKSKPRIYVDFAKRTAPTEGDTYIALTCDGTFRDLAEQNISLEEGLEVTFYMDDADGIGNDDDLEIGGYVHFDKARNSWVGVVRWNELKHVSERFAQ